MLFTNDANFGIGNCPTANTKTIAAKGCNPVNDARITAKSAMNNNLDKFLIGTIF
jgi:hypothetical protein